MSLTRFDIDAAFGRLQAAGLPLPPTWEAVGRGRVAAEWQQALGEAITKADLDAAVTGYIRTDRKFWPTPGQLLALAPPRATTHGPSWREPDLRRYDWYALRAGPDGPVVRLLPDWRARRDGLARADDATCPDDGCACPAVEVAIHQASAFSGTFGRMLQDVPPRRWLWSHTAAALPPTAYTVVPR